MTDLATKPGADGAQPDDAALVDDPAAADAEELEVDAADADELDAVDVESDGDAAEDVEAEADDVASSEADEVEDDDVETDEHDEAEAEASDAAEIEAAAAAEIDADELDVVQPEPEPDAADTDSTEVEAAGVEADELREPEVDGDDAALDSETDLDTALEAEPEPEPEPDPEPNSNPAADEPTTVLDAVATPAVDTPAPVDPAIDPATEALSPIAATTDRGADVDPEAPIGGGPDAPGYAWAPSEPAPKKSRKALWIGLAAGAAVIALAVASVTLIAPGTSVAGVSVGLLPTAAATDVVNQRLADTTIVLVGEGGDAEVTGADLGASVDASGLVADAFAAHPLWNVTSWFPASIDAPVRIDAETASSALRAAAPELYTEPVDATLAFDATSVSYVTTPAELGTGIDVDALRTTLQEAFEAGETRVEFDATAVPVEATTPTYVAEAAARRLNGILTTAGFYVGSERTVPVSREVAASWLTVTPGERGTFEISADASAIEELVGGLPEAVNREVVDAKTIIDSGGEVLRELSAGVSGRELGDTSAIADEYAAQLAAGDAKYELPVTETKFATTALERRIEVDLSRQTTYLFENDDVIASYAISSGLPATPTQTGSFRIFAHVSIQDMGALCYDPEAQNSYCTEDVPWITYFNGDQGFHGTYWHNNFGNPMSHGCVNMPIDVAKFLYDWAPTGTEVHVYA